MGISVAMVGTGAFAQGFIPLFKAHPLVERIALCDLDAKKLEDNKARHGIAESFPSLDEVCASDFDAAVIITQPWLHGPQAVQALRAGKHAWSAVPAGRTLDECRALVQAVEETGRIYMMAETSYYYPAVIYCRRRHGEGAFGSIVYSECEYYHDWDHGLYAVARWRGGERWRWSAGAPPMYYPTHSTSQIMSVTGARMTRVSCQGFVDHHSDAVYQAANNEYGNTFSNEVALFAMSDGSACRVNEFRRIGHPGAVRMSLFGTEGSFEEAVGSQRFLGKGNDDAVDVSDLLTCRTEPADGDRGAHPPGGAAAARVRRAAQRPRRRPPVPGRRLRSLLPRGNTAAQPRVERRRLHGAGHRRPRVGAPRRRVARHPGPGVAARMMKAVSRMALPGFVWMSGP